jgi:signal transduction histidine kinase
MRLGHWIALDCVAGLVAALCDAAAAANHLSPGEVRLPMVLLVLVGVFLPVALRRRAPVFAFAALVFLGVALARLSVGAGALIFLSAAYVLYTLTVEARKRTGAAALALLLATMVGLGITSPRTVDPRVAATQGTDTGVFIPVALAGVIAWMTGYSVRQRRRYVVTLQQQAANSAVAEERLRIARELHDVVAHSMSVIAVQAGYGQYVIDSSPDDAREALGAIQATSRDALEEMRRMLGVLRQQDAGAGAAGTETGPPPGSAPEPAAGLTLPSAPALAGPGGSGGTPASDAATGARAPDPAAAALDTAGSTAMTSEAGSATAGGPAAIGGDTRAAGTGKGARRAKANGTDAAGGKDTDSADRDVRDRDARDRDARDRAARDASYRAAAVSGPVAAAGRAPLAPAPGLAALDRLISRTRGAGVRLTLEVSGQARPAPAGVDLSAFRIIQEALTNVVKHARTGAACVVSLTYTDADLVIRVTDDGGRAAAPGLVGARPADMCGSGTGHGIIGMRERVNLCGGTFTAGPRPEGGFQVTAALPLPVIALPSLPAASPAVTSTPAALSLTSALTTALTAALTDGQGGRR